MVLRLLQQKYNQANPHFKWSDEFLMLVDAYSSRIRADPTNKYVHIRDVVTELNAYKGKPMKKVIPSTHNVGLDSDHFVERNTFPAVKRAKVELMDLKHELHEVKPESANRCMSDELTSVTAVCLSSSTLCKLVPLSAMSSAAQSADVDVSQCKLIDVLTEDSDSCSSIVDDNSLMQPDTGVDAYQLVSSVHGEQRFVGNSSDLTANCSSELVQLTEMRSSVELSADFVNQSVEQPECRHDNAEVQPLTSQAAMNDSSQAAVSDSLQAAVSDSSQAAVSDSLQAAVNDLEEPVAHCSTQHDEHASPSKLASARHIRYLEMLLSVGCFWPLLVCTRQPLLSLSV